MESRRIRRVRRPTPWQRFVAHWHAWLEDTLEKAVCCGVDPATLADERFAMGSKQASAAFSIRSMSAYCGDESELGDYEDACEVLSDTESESTNDDHLSDSRCTAIDMEARYSLADCNDGERRRMCMSSEYIPFDDEDGLERLEVHDAAIDGCIESVATHQGVKPVDEDRRLHRFLFNCVLAELLMTSHPVGLWAQSTR